MKSKLLKLLAISTVFAFGVGAFANVNQKPVKVEAAQYVGNFDLYSYSGSYYNSIDFDLSDGMDGNLRKAITALIKPQGYYTYGSLGDDHLSTQLQYADEDPTNSSNMIYFYTRDSVKKNNSISGTGNWNREHVWPQANSNGNWDGNQGTQKCGTDVLHIRPTYETPNGTRGNLRYGDNNKSGPQTYNNMVYGYKSANYFEPLDEVKGDVARIIMYVWTTYTGYQGYSSIDILSTFESYDTLLKWHAQDKPDVLEGNRNNYAEQSIQKNRNPFVDHPELAWRIFGDSASQSVKNACIEAYPLEGYEVEQKTLTKIEISGEANKKEYFAGEEFDPTGLKVTATYSDGSSKEISNSNCTWTPNPLTVGTTTVTCTYNKLTATYSGITVVANSNNGVFKVEFVASGADGSSELSKDEIFESYFKTNTLIKSVDTATKVYPGVSGLKLGSSKAVGLITLTLKEEARNNIESIDIETTKYGSDKDGYMVVKLGNETLTDTAVPGEDYSETLDSISASTLTITTTAKRLYLNKITITLHQEEVPSTDDSSSEPIESSSSEIPASSSEPSSSEESSVPASTSEESASSATATSETKVDDSSAPTEEPKKEAGCHGSLLATFALTGFTSLIGLVFVLSKKKK